MCEILRNVWNFVKCVKFWEICEILWILWNFENFEKFCEICEILWNLWKIFLKVHPLIWVENPSSPTVDTSSIASADNDLSRISSKFLAYISYWTTKSSTEGFCRWQMHADCGTGSVSVRGLGEVQLEGVKRYFKVNSFLELDCLSS